MKLFRKNNTTAEAPTPTERHCRGCGSALADDQLACLTCGAVDEPGSRRDRRWMLPTGGVVGVALFLVTSASFAATTALRTGDPQAIKQDPPQVAQTPPVPPASGDGSVPQAADEGKGPDLGAGGDSAAPPAGGGDEPPADDGGDGGDAGADSGSDSSGDSGSSGGGGSNAAPKPDKPDPKPVQISEWPAGREGYTVIVYTFNSKSEAKVKAREVAADGHPAGVLDSSDFKSLEPGSWLVYIGEYDSAQEAERAAAKFDRDYPGEVTYVGDNQSPEYEDSQAGASSESQTQP